MEFPSRYKDWPFKILVMILWGEGEVEGIRREENRFLLETRFFSERFNKKVSDIHAAIRNLEKMGYVYNTSFECGRVRFHMNLPGYLGIIHKRDRPDTKVDPVMILNPKYANLGREREERGEFKTDETKR